MGGTADTVAVRPLDAAGAQARPQTGAPSAAAGAGWRIIKFFLALALLPACVGFTLAVYEHFVPTWPNLSFALHGAGLMLKWFCGGAAVFAALAILLWRPVVIYVFGHEAVHALATWLCLGKVSNLSASAKGGQVTTSKSNTFIRLAPYCVPLYALLAASAYVALNHWWRPLDPYAHWLAFALGFLYAFHVGFSLWSLRRDQPDLKADGWLFSLVLIYLANLFVFVLLIAFVLDGNPRHLWPVVKDVATAGWQHTAQIYQNLSACVDRMLRP